MDISQSYQLADELARAFSERTILQIFIKEETTQSPGRLKVHFLYITITFSVSLVCKLQNEKNQTTNHVVI